MAQLIDSMHMGAFVSTENGTNASSASLLILNNHCLLEISMYFGLYDTINLSKTCRRLKALAETFMFKKFSELTIHRKMFVVGGEKLVNEEEVNEVLSHVGSHVIKLECERNAKNFWSIVNDKCKQLKHVNITEWKEETEETLQNFLGFDCFKNVASLDLTECRLRSNSNFLSSFGNLNHLSSHNSVQVNDLEMLLRNNRNLKSCQFVPVFSYGFVKDMDESMDEMDFRCFEMVPKLEVLDIALPRADYYTIFAKMKLKKLERHYSNINRLLIQFYVCMEELILGDVVLDIKSINILKSFTKLRYLDIYYRENFGECRDAFPTLPIGWPENLTKLTLNGIDISFENYLATLKHLNRLETFDLRWSCGADSSDEEKFYDIDFVQKQTLKAIRYHHKLTVILPMNGIYCSGRLSSQIYLVDSERLRLVNNSGGFISI